jgi:hypothetical protein
LGCGAVVIWLGEESGKEEIGEEVFDLYMKWRIRFLKLVSVVVESAVGELARLKDNGRREENTLAGLRCCSDLWCKETEEKSIGKLFKLIKFNRGLSRELTDT